MSLDSNATLLPCPFCPKSKLVIANKSEVDECEHAEHCNGCGSNPDNDDYVAVFCDATIGGCGAFGGYAPTKKEAIAKWNARSQPSEWVAVTDRLPITEADMAGKHYESVQVIVCMPNGDVRAEDFVAGTQGPFWCAFNFLHGEQVTHWMPLPKPPALLPPKTEAKS